MQNNMLKMIDNQDEVNRMEIGSEEIVKTSFEIRGNARGLERQAKVRKQRMMLMMGCAIIIFIIILIWILN